MCGITLASHFSADVCVITLDRYPASREEGRRLPDLLAGVS